MRDNVTWKGKAGLGPLTPSKCQVITTLECEDPLVSAGAIQLYYCLRKMVSIIQQMGMGMSQQNGKERRNSSVTKSTHCSLEDPSSNSSTQISADHSKLSSSLYEHRECMCYRHTCKQTHKIPYKPGFTSKTACSKQSWSLDHVGGTQSRRACD